MLISVFKMMLNFWSKWYLFTCCASFFFWEYMNSFTVLWYNLSERRSPLIARDLHEDLVYEDCYVPYKFKTTWWKLLKNLLGVVGGGPLHGKIYLKKIIPEARTKFDIHEFITIFLWGYLKKVIPEVCQSCALNYISTVFFF